MPRKTAVTEVVMARQATPDERACRAPRPGPVKYVCAAVEGHEGDHIPYGAADSREGLLTLAWPNRKRRAIRR